MWRISSTALLLLSAYAISVAFATEGAPISLETPSPAAAPSPGPSPSASIASAASILWNRAMEAFSARNFKVSAKLLQEYVDQYPGTPEAVDARYSLAQSYLYGREPEKSIAPFRSVIEIRGKTVLGNEARTYLGQAYLDAAKYSEAYLVSEELISQEGISTTFRAKALLLRAHAQAGLRQNLEAEKTLVAYQSIAESDPELERETAASFLVSLLLKANHCDALPSAKSLPEDQLIDQVSRKSICVLEMGAHLAKASKQLNATELIQGADTLAASIASLRTACTNPPLAPEKRSKKKLETAKNELVEKLRENCKTTETLITESFKERENLRGLQSRILGIPAKTETVKSVTQESRP